MQPDNLEFIALIREVMDDATTKIQLAQDVKDVPAAMVKRLHFSRREDWMVFGSCLYTFEDAAMAIRGYFATAGESQGRDHEYLRLFGFLNACYLQLGSLERLCTIVHVVNKNDIVGTLRDHELIQCRNMLASHTVAYRTGEFTHSITIEQISLGGTSATFMVNETDERRHCSFETIHLSWAQETRAILDAVVRQFIGTVYKPNAVKQAEYLNRLDELAGISD